MREVERERGEEEGDREIGQLAKRKRERDEYA